jgi:transposase
MKDITLLAIDLAKNVFQLHGTDRAGKCILSKKIHRGKLSETIANLPTCNIYMEACGSSNYWGRKFERFGHRVKFIHPKYVKPYVKRNKNDRNDAAAIAAAARDPDMRFCKTKTKEQQDIQSIHRMRSLLVHQRTALANHIRGILAEYGIVFPKGRHRIQSFLAAQLGDNPNDLSGLMLEGLQDFYEQIQRLNKKIASDDDKIKRLFKTQEPSKRLAEIPGVGPLGATIVNSVLGNGSGFKNGRHFAAFLGLVPKQHSSGSKDRLLGISKGGDAYIRTLLIHGARSVLLRVGSKKDPHSIWLKNLAIHRGNPKATVAFANKMARMAWALMANDRAYDPYYETHLR